MIIEKGIFNLAVELLNTAKVYNALIDAVDNKKFIFPSNNEIAEAKGQIRKLNRRNMEIK